MLSIVILYKKIEIHVAKYRYYIQKQKRGNETKEKTMENVKKIFRRYIVKRECLYVFIGMLYLGAIAMDIIFKIPIVFSCCHWDKFHDILKDVYGIVWGVTIGIIVFVSQNGYGTIYGLQMVDILIIYFDKIEIVLISLFYIIKLAAYEVFYLMDMKWTLLAGQIEVFSTFIYIIYLFVKLSNPERVSCLLEKDTKKNIELLYSDEQNINWRLKKSVDNLNYSSTESCNVVINNLSSLYNSISIPEIDPENLYDNAESRNEYILKYEKLHNILSEYKQFTDIIFGKNIDRNIVINIICRCGKKIKSESGIKNSFLFYRNILIDRSYKITQKELFYILSCLSQESEKRILIYLMITCFYLKDHAKDIDLNLLYYGLLKERFLVLNNPIIDYKNKINEWWENAAFIYYMESVWLYISRNSDNLENNSFARMSAQWDSFKGNLFRDIISERNK